MNESPQKTAAEPAKDRGGNVGPHDHAQSLSRQGSRKPRRQAGGERRDKEPLNEASRHQNPEVVGHGGDQASSGHTDAPREDDGVNGPLIGTGTRKRWLERSIPRITAETVRETRTGVTPNSCSSTGSTGWVM